MNADIHIDLFIIICTNTFIHRSSAFVHTDTFIRLLFFSSRWPSMQIQNIRSILTLNQNTSTRNQKPQTTIRTAAASPEDLITAHWDTETVVTVIMTMPSTDHMTETVTEVTEKMIIVTEKMHEATEKIVEVTEKIAEVTVKMAEVTVKMAEATVTAHTTEMVVYVVTAMLGHVTDAMTNQVKSTMP